MTTAMTESERRQTIKSAGRQLVNAPVLLQDWDDEGEEHSARFWELFVDLLLVATASVVADGLKEDTTLEGVSAFVCLYLIFFYGWYAYVHVTTRFEDSSLLHSFNLFFYLLGMASCVMNADGFNNVRGFAISVSIQQMAVLMMMVPIAICIPRARMFCLVWTCSTALGLVCLVASAIIDTKESARYLWWFAAILEFNFETIALCFLRGSRLVPINIEHSTERMGCLVLVMLGETVLSVTLNYRSQSEHEDDSFYDKEYYAVMILSFLLIFMFALLYFHMEPSRQDHAFRRSRFHGLLYLTAFKILGLGLLSIGVGVKLVVETVLEDELLNDFASTLIGVSVGLALLSLYVMRIMHYGGKLPRPSDPPGARRLMIAWWCVVGLGALLPFGVCVVLVREGWNDPISTLGIYAGIVTVLCVVESCFSHILRPHLLKPLSDPESESLLTTTMEENSKSTYTTFRS